MKIEPKDFEFVAHCLLIAGHHFKEQAKVWSESPEDQLELDLAASYQEQVERCNSIIYAMEIHEEDEDDA